jgi:hypothetical protein
MKDIQTLLDSGTSDECKIAVYNRLAQKEQLDRELQALNQRIAQLLQELPVSAETPSKKS